MTSAGTGASARGEDSCPFCHVSAESVFYTDDIILGIWDRYPVTPGHALLVPKRHVPTWFDATDEEQRALLEGIEQARSAILRRHKPDGFNVGINIGEAAGQTMFHLHIHVIPRQRGDVEDPRGGVRHVIPTLGNYLVREPAVTYGPTRPAIVGGDHDPFDSHLLDDLAEARHVDIAVAFTLESGISRIQPYLQDILRRPGGRIRFLTGDYFTVTEPRALQRLLDLEAGEESSVECRVFETTKDLGFHPKAYLIHAPGVAAAYVGSSNLTRHALERGVEWNYRIDAQLDMRGFASVAAEFEALFEHRRTVPLTDEWISAYRERFRSRHHQTASMPIDPEEPPPPATPHAIQREALEALRETRKAGNRAGLIVLATGLGKTWLSAFDSLKFGRVLFVAHRMEILNQSRETFRRIRPESHLGLYDGREKAVDADVLFASVQTLGRSTHLHRFARDAFDYIVIDEFHHAAASTYRRIINYFKPRFLLGLTATPERTDGADLLTLCDENLVFRADLNEGITRKMLAPFHYYGVPDVVEYAQIPWRSGRFDPAALETAVVTEQRASNAIEQWRRRAGKRTLAFCVSQKHADFMADFFRENDVPAVAVHSGPTSASRTKALEDLEAGTLSVICSVDIFNEGVDIPTVDTVMMLRPTESRIVWLQQIGRGLRVVKGKDHLTVVDYIGNHRTFLKALVLLFPGVGDTPAELAMALRHYRDGALELPDGCEVTYDLEAIDVLEALIPKPKGEEAIRIWYYDFRERHGMRPSAADSFHAGYSPKGVRSTHGSWLQFVLNMGDLSVEEGEALGAGRSFLDALGTTQMTKSYKMVLLLSMIAKEKLPGEISIDELAHAFAERAQRSAALVRDVGDALESHIKLRRHLEQNPIAAWTEGKGTGGQAYFRYQGGTFSTTIEMPPRLEDTFREMTREICEWRLAEYLDRVMASAGVAPEIICRVSRNSSGQPVLSLPTRDKNPGIPDRWTTVTAAGVEYLADFDRIAINVLREADDERNVLPELLRKWFGQEAGQPGGEVQRVMFAWQGDGYVIKPLGQAGPAPELWKEYMRAEIPALWGMEYSKASWQQGYIQKDKHMFLLVTLEKKGMQEEHQYADRFLAPDTFQWQSQNRASRDSKTGNTLQNHEALGIKVHLLVRRAKKTQRGKASPFTYCGDVKFVDWKGDNPITIQWRLGSELPKGLGISVPQHGS